MGVFELAEASESAPPAAEADAPPALPPPTGRLRQALTDPSSRTSAPERPAKLRNALAEETRKAAESPNVGPHLSEPEENPSLSAPRLSGRLAALAETAKAYARAAQADNTQRAYAADWRISPPGCAARGSPRRRPTRKPSASTSPPKSNAAALNLSVATLERRLSGIAWRYRQLGEPLEIRDRHIATVLAGIRRRHGRPPLQKAAIFADELLAMLATLRWICVACATGRSSRSALPAAFGAQKSSVSIAGPARPKTAPAGSNSFLKARS